MTDEIAKTGQQDVAPSDDWPADALATDQRVLEASRSAVKAGRSRVASAVNVALVDTYWTIGKEVMEATGERAAYGQHLIAFLSEELTAEFGKGFSVRTLREARQFFRTFPIRRTVCAELSWSHYRRIMRLEDPEARDFYIRESDAGHWSLSELKRQIDTRLYERIVHTQKAKALEGVVGSEAASRILGEAGGIEGAEAMTPDGVLKDPMVFEFLDIPVGRHVVETDLEAMLIASLEDFLLELGRGFAFVKRQRRLTSNGEDWWIDLVFYNYFLRRFVLLELKTGKLTPQDVGQLEFYLNFFDDKHKLPTDEPSIGILLCAQKDDVVVRYSALARNENLMAAQYFTYLPTEEELEMVLRRNQVEFEERLARELPEPGAEDSR